jgi:hypothetical protein
VAASAAWAEAWVAASAVAVSVVAAASAAAAAGSPAVVRRGVGSMRWIRHVAAKAQPRKFTRAMLAAIHKAISAGEQRHRGQVCFAIEQALPLRDLVGARSVRERAHEAFAQLRVWDTVHNSGVLIYVLVAEHAIEIVADRGIAARVDQAEWQDVCNRMLARFAATDFERGAVEGVQAVSDILAREFPSNGTPRDNELSDEPIIL